MRILLSNDDGVAAPGLKVLETIARAFTDDIWIVAPAEEQSGTGRSLTLTRPVRVHQLGERRWAVTGTPTDAVMIALAELMKDGRPDLVLSGVNRGANLAEDVHYSGTVAAAAEAALAGIPAVALSQRYPEQGMGNRVTYEAAEAWGERVLAPLVARLAAWTPRTLVNINFPPVPADRVSGVRVARQGLRDYGRLKLDARTDPRGFPYYWLALGRIPQTPAADTDLEAAQSAAVTVTPLHLDMTYDPALTGLADAYA